MFFWINGLLHLKPQLAEKVLASDLYDLDAQDVTGATLLSKMVQLGKYEVADRLLKLGANPGIKDCCGFDTYWLVAQLQKVGGYSPGLAALAKALDK